MQNEFKIVDNRSVWVSGIVQIESKSHRVQNGYIFCNSSLNHKSWNTTNETSKCEICFQNIQAFKPMQLKLF